MRVPRLRTAEKPSEPRCVGAVDSGYTQAKRLLALAYAHLATVLSGVAVTPRPPYWFRRRITPEWARSVAETIRQRKTTLISLLGLLILIGLGLAGLLAGFQEVKPITGLTTFGGFLGGMSAIVAYNAARRWPCRWSTIVAILEGYVLIRPERTIIILGYATFGGYSYARILWNIGARVFNLNGYIIGRIIWPITAAGNALVAFVLVMGVLLAIRRLQGTPLRELERRTVLADASAAAAYCAWLFVMTGLAGVLWFPLFGVPP